MRSKPECVTMTASQLPMPMKLNSLACTGQCQMIAIERAKPGMVERVVVKPTEPFASRVVRPNPFFESFFDALLLLACGLGCLRVDDGFFIDHVIDGGRL